MNFKIIKFKNKMIFKIILKLNKKMNFKIIIFKNKMIFKIIIN